jgi:hypothetical protein
MRSELSRNSRPWTVDEDTINGLDLIDASFNTPVVSDVPIGLMSSEELACDGIDGETRVLLARVKKSVIGFPWVVVRFFVFFAINNKNQ